MTIKTKYSLGDKVWVMFGNRPREASVSTLQGTHRLGEKKSTVNYWLHMKGEGVIREHFPEATVYPTKEALLKSL